MEDLNITLEMYESLNEMSDAECLAAFKALGDYSFYGTEPVALPSGIVKVFFNMSKKMINDRKQSRLYGKKGGRPKKEREVLENNNPPFDKLENPVSEIKSGVIKKEYPPLSISITGNRTPVSKEENKEERTKEETKEEIIKPDNNIYNNKLPRTGAHEAEKKYYQGSVRKKQTKSQNKYGGGVL